ncbi:hypothetical protein HDU98_004122 [Podochytrium sp. JEL0797]|nr:hypothetical protein HDU98_004122 [Podochytrium sp. JEL0797]
MATPTVFRAINAYSVRQLTANASKSIDLPSPTKLSSLTSASLFIGPQDRCHAHAAATLFAANEMPRLWHELKQSVTFRAVEIAKEDKSGASRLEVVLGDNSTKSLDLSDCKTSNDILAKLDSAL